MPTLTETLTPQFKIILQKYTRSAKLDEMVAELMQAVERESPKVAIEIPVAACQHITRLKKNPDGTTSLVCKKCGDVQSIGLTSKR